MDIIVAALVIGPVISIAIFLAFQQWLPRKHWSQLDSCGAAGDPLRRARHDRRLPLRPLIPPSTHVDSVEIEQLLKRYAGEQFGRGFTHQRRQRHQANRVVTD